VTNSRAEFTEYYNHHRSHMSRDHLSPVRDEPDDEERLRVDQVEVKSYVGGLVKAFERKAAKVSRLDSLPFLCNGTSAEKVRPQPAKKLLWSFIPDCSAQSVLGFYGLKPMILPVLTAKSSVEQEG